MKEHTAPVRGVARVPVVIQMEALECGAACLSMVLSYYGKWIPLEEMRRVCGVSRDGSNGKNILLAARSYGLQAAGYRLSLDQLREQASYPCILHWNFNHFVVLCGFRGRKAIINDPAKGNYAISMETLSRSFTGICMLMEPAEGFRPSGKPRGVLKFARKKLAGTGTAFGLVALTTVIASLFGMFTPGFSSVFADRLLSGRNPEWFGPFMLLLGIFTALQLAVEFIKGIYTLRANGKITVTSDSEFMWHVLRLPMSFFEQRLVGDLIDRKNQNSTIASLLISSLAPLLIQGGMMLFYLLVMVRYSWQLALLGILSVLLNGILSGFISRKRVNLTRVSSRDRSKLYSTTMAAVEMMESIKASGAESGYFEKWAGYQANVNAQEAQYIRQDVQWGILPAALSVLTNFLIFLGSIYLCMKGSWTIGMISAFSGYFGAFIAPANSAVGALQRVQETQTAMERIQDVMEYPTDADCSRDVTDTQELSKLTGKIQLKNVTFGYSPLAAPLIENFSLTLEPGQKVAFVGGSGCGKSTLAKLIAGLYQPWSGEILFDGKPIREIPRSVFTGSVAVVDQDITIFHDSILENIRMWDRSIENFEVILAARDAQIHEDIVKRQGGYYAMLEEGGRNLSGGQRQRLEIARVLAQDPTVLILDEATSALDSQTEFQVVNAISQRGVTSIVVAHRLSTIRDCDEIIVLDHGKVAERGTHQQLFDRRGLYWQLVSNE